MIPWRHTRTLLVLVIAGGLVGSLMPALNGCTGDGPSVSHVAEVVGIDPYHLSDESERELARFNAVFRTYVSNPGDSRELKQFRDAYKRIRSLYVERIADAKLVDAAIKGVHEEKPEPGSLVPADLVEKALDSMTASLDPHSAYLTPEELRESELVTSGEFGGLGIQVTQENGQIKVISPIKGTPADLAGLKPGDLITHLDGAPIAEFSLRDAVNAMRGEPGTQIRLTIQRNNQPPLDVTLTRAVITIEPVRWTVTDSVGYIRIVSFNEKVEEGVEAALQGIRERLGSEAKGLVLDLRNNPGGLLDQSLAVADAFLEDGAIVSIRGRDVHGNRTFEAGPGDIASGLPMVVLINGGSASASEIVAAAFQDHGRATVMGGRTFGKGSVQTVMRLPLEGALKLTTALYYGPAGGAIQAHGVDPDIKLSGIEQDSNQPHEVDLPGALPAQRGLERSAEATVDARACPEFGDEKDREIGCAVAFLEAGSTDRFLASLGTRARL